MRFLLIFSATAVLGILICCASYNAGIRRVAEARMRGCKLDPREPWVDVNCVERVRVWCSDRGLERTCGEAAWY